MRAMGVSYAKRILPRGHKPESIAYAYLTAITLTDHLSIARGTWKSTVLWDMHTGELFIMVSLHPSERSIIQNGRKTIPVPLFYCGQHYYEPGALRVVAGHPVLDPYLAIVAFH